MKKASSFVLRALNILSFEQILKLTKVLKVSQGQLKKAAGEELVSWDGPETMTTPIKTEAPASEAKVLNFKKKNDLAQIEMPESDEEIKKKKEAEESEGLNLLASDVVLWQREITREAGKAAHKMDAQKGYQKSTEMYVVKTKTDEGKEKIRFASTDGILVNKKQA